MAYDSITVAYKTEKGKIRREDKEDVFAIIEKNDTIFFYQPQNNGDFTVNEMKNVIAGKNSGRKYKNNYILAGGLVFGIISPFIMASVGLPSAFSPIIPLIYDIIIGNISAKNYKSDNPDKNYTTAFNKEVKKKRTLIAILGSIIGLVIGLIIAFFVLEKH